MENKISGFYSSICQNKNSVYYNNGPCVRVIWQIVYAGQLTLYSIITPFDTFEIKYLKNLWKMEHLLFWSKSSIFHNIFKSIPNLT